MKNLLRLIFIIFLPFNIGYASNIIASNYQLSLIIGPDTQYIVPKNSEPHAYNLKPSDIIKIKSAKKFITFEEYSNISPENTLNLNYDIHSIYNIPQTVKMLKKLDKIKLKTNIKDLILQLEELHRNNIEYFSKHNISYIATHDGLRGFADNYNIKSYGSILNDHDHHAKPSEKHESKEAINKNSINCLIYQDDSELKEISASDLLNIKKIQIKHEIFNNIEYNSFYHLMLDISNKFRECLRPLNLS